MKLTDQQVENWRKVLTLTIGPYAMMAPREQIEQIAENIQQQVNKIKVFEIHWLDGRVETITGTSISDAWNTKGLGRGAVDALDYYKELKDE